MDANSDISDIDNTQLYYGYWFLLLNIIGSLGVVVEINLVVLIKALQREIDSGQVFIKAC